MWEMLTKDPKALFLAIFVHLILIGVLMFSLDWTPKTPLSGQPKSEVIKAVALDDSKVAAEMDRLEAAEKREEQEAAERLKVLEEKAREAEQTRKREQQQLAELKKKQEAEQQRQAEIERKKVAEQQRLAELKKQQETIERKQREEEKRLAELEAKRKMEEAERKAAEEAGAVLEVLAAILVGAFIPDSGQEGIALMGRGMVDLAGIETGAVCPRGRSGPVIDLLLDFIPGHGAAG